jgi:predicted CXXCH cytochrome family protein
MRWGLRRRGRFRAVAVRMPFYLLAVALLAAGTLLALGRLELGRAAPADTSGVPQPGDARVYFYPPCLSCHLDPSLVMTLPSGETMSLYVDASALDNSVHGTQLSCVDCHQRNISYPHIEVKVQTRRDYAAAEYELCKRCHFENYTKTIDSMHFEAMAKNNPKAPLCTDCHGAHTVAKSNGSRSQVAQTCANCHAQIYDEYAESVHGSVLLKDNPDVPVCTTCHGVHNIHSAVTSSFRQSSVQLCVECHSNGELMAKYGVSDDVSKTYLDDFHGKTVGFYQSQDSKVWPDVAVCTDCHGVHDIKKVDDPDSSVVKENLVTTCRKCHADATANFPSAWLSHYQPSANKHVLVYFVHQYYRVLIPLMVAGLMLNVGLDLWRLARNR